MTLYAASAEPQLS